MPIPRIYYTGRLKIDEEAILSPWASHHIIQVLRLKANDTINLFNGDNQEYCGKIISTINKIVRVHIKTSSIKYTDSKLNIELGQGIAKGDRMDTIIQKAVELGVACITPLITERCNVRLDPKRWQKKIAHWEKIIIHAAMQSGRCSLPTLNSPTPLAEWLNSSDAELKLLCDPKSSQKLTDFTTNNKVIALIGPEGGLSPNEINHATQQSFSSISLGPRILRTETAAIILLALLQGRWGDM